MMKLILWVGVAVQLAAASVSQTSAKDDDKKEEEDESTLLSFDPNKSIRKILTEYNGDFGSDLFQMLLTRKDISHLLLSDVNNMENALLKEFPDIMTLQSIGQTWENRDINVLTLDARKYVASAEFASIPVPEKKVVMQKVAVGPDANATNGTNTTSA